MTTEYPFPEDPELREYRVFGEGLENDSNVFFHGTSAANLRSILTDGFAFPDHTRAQSVSFASSSSVPLRYACEARGAACPEGGIIAVRYVDWKRRGIEYNGSILHDRTLEPQPEIIGYCIVPSSYVFR